MPRLLIKELIGVLIFFETLWTLNLATAFFAPSISVGTVPKHHYVASTLIEIPSFKGIAYTEEQAIERLSTQVVSCFWLSLAAVVMAAVGLATVDISRALRQIGWVSSIVLFFFSLILM